MCRFGLHTVLRLRQMTSMDTSSDTLEKVRIKMTQLAAVRLMFERVTELAPHRD